MNLLFQDDLPFSTEKIIGRRNLIYGNGGKVIKKRAPISNNPNVEYKGVKEVMGLPSSVDPFPPATLGMLTSTFIDEVGVGLPDLGGLPNLFSTFVFLLGGGLSASCRAFS
jgi:hypothetical protein